MRRVWGVWRVWSDSVERRLRNLPRPVIRAGCSQAVAIVGHLLGGGRRDRLRTFMKLSPGHSQPTLLVLESGVSREQRDFLFVLVVPMVFAIPFLLFSIPGGYFADRFSKRSVTTWTKRLELLTMGFATYVFWKNRLDLAAVALFFICTQEAIF